MSRVCCVSGRGSGRAASRSHSNIKTLRRQHLNLQTKKINGKKYKLSASAIRTMRKLIRENGNLSEFDALQKIAKKHGIQL